MNSLKNYLLLLTSFFWIEAFSQEVEPINTDRPDQSDGTYIIAENTGQIETGLLYGNDGAGYFIHNTMFRYGLGKNTEARILIDYGKVDTTTVMLPLGISFKHQLVKQNKILPAITLVGYAYLPFLATKNIKPDKLPYTFLLAFQNDINDRLGVGYNVGINSDGNSSMKNWMGTVSIGYEIMKHLSFYTEYFGQYNKHSSFDHNLDIGVLYPITKNLQLDIALGTSLFNQASNRFITSGISFRFR